MADEPKRSSRSASTGATRTGRAKAEKPELAAAAPTAPERSPQPTTTAASTHTAPPTPAVAEPSGSGSGVALAGLIAGVVGIVLALAYPLWTPIVYGSGNRLTADQVRTETKGEIDALKASIAAMTEKQASQEQAIRTAKLPGILMVAEDLRTALGDSGPYAGTLNLFRSLTGSDAEAAAIIAAVEGRAEVGVPTVEDVQERFDEIAHAILTAEQRPQASGDLASQVSDTVASLTAATMRLRWRLDGAPTGDGVAAVVARAEQAAGNGELQVAVDTLGLLPEQRAALAQPWIDMVRARMQAETVREDLDAYIISMAARIQ